MAKLHFLNGSSCFPKIFITRQIRTVGYQENYKGYYVEEGGEAYLVPRKSRCTKLYKQNYVLSLKFVILNYSYQELKI